MKCRRKATREYPVERGQYYARQSQQSPFAGWLEPLRFRYLLIHLVASDVRSRYRRTSLGILWAVVWPILFSTIFSVVAVNIFHTPLGIYVAYVVTGFTVWDFLAGAINGGTVSLTQAEGYLRQARLPYVLFPIRTVSYLAVNFMFGSIACALVILLVVPGAAGPTWAWWPVCFAMAFLFAVPLAAISAVANLKFRDYSYGISLVVFLLWYLSPALIAREIYEKPNLKPFTDVNPLASMIDLFRDPLLNRLPPQSHDLVIVAVYTAGLWVIAGLWMKVEGRRLIYHM